MAISSSNFDPSRLLEREMRIECAGTHFYKIGLSLYPDSRVKRKKYRNPLVGFIFQLVYLVRSVILLLHPDGDLDYFRKVGDFGFIFGTIAQFEITVIFTILMSFDTQILNYFLYKSGIRPTYLRLFEMISGQIPPNALGLFSEVLVTRIIRTARLLFLIANYIPLSLGSSIFMINFLSFYSNSSWSELFIYVIPQSIGWFLIVMVVYNNTVWQLVYFYLIALYLKSKLKEVNIRLNVGPKGKQPALHLKIIHDLSKIYAEIYDYNSTYWSQYLLIVWINSGAILSTLSFFLIFGEMAFFIRIFVFYFDIFFILLILLVINTCATVYLEANKSHKLLMTLLCNQRKRNSLKKFKV